MTGAAPRLGALDAPEPGLERAVRVPARPGLGLLQAALEGGLEPSVFWEDEDEVLVGLGVRDEIRAGGPDRFERADAALAARARPSERWFGGFSFEDGEHPDFAAFGSLRFFLPRIVWRWRRGDSAALLGAGRGVDDFSFRRAVAWAEADRTVPAPNQGPAAARADRAGWRERMAAGSAALAEGRVSKVVLSRRIEVEAERPLDVAAVLAALPRRNEAEAAFALFAGDACFLGLSPERLVRVEGHRAWTEALAGTSPAQDPDGLALSSSDKDREEHRHVLEHLVRTLGERAERVEADDVPSVRCLGPLAHLCTPVHAVGVDPGHLLSLAGALHPTPAVCGVPPEAAAGVIGAAEGAPRGWYAGGLGWVCPGGSGPGAPDGRCELRVALRSALVRGHRATVFVGAGIVRGSTEAAEWEETALKATRTLRALGA